MHKLMHKLMRRERGTRLHSAHVMLPIEVSKTTFGFPMMYPAGDRGGGGQRGARVGNTPRPASAHCFCLMTD
eukprot:5901546-Prymnesium_polylepis.2